MELHRIGVKLFCQDGPADGPPVGLREFIPIFHRWIQIDALGELLVDVADYSHVPRGPGILLVAHAGIYGIDETGDRRGLVYYRRHPVAGNLADRLASVTRAALAACHRLASEPELRGRLAFRGDELLVFANDRLLAPNTEATLNAVQPSLAALLARLYPGLACATRREPDAKERFAVAVTAPQAVAVETLLQRLGG
jgi:hypothetical protein